VALNITSHGIQGEVICECSEDVTRTSEIMVFNVPSSNMSIAFLDSSVENLKGG